MGQPAPTELEIERALRAVPCMACRVPFDLVMWNDREIDRHSLMSHYPRPDYPAMARAVEARLTAEHAALRREIERIKQTIGHDGDDVADQVEKEWHDFMMVVDHLSETYGHFSDGRISKPQTLPEEVFRVADDLETERVNEAVAEETEALTEDLRAEVAGLRARVEGLAKGLRAVEALIAESHGVAGLHRNGDLASWKELRTGGRFETWLLDFDDALTLAPPPPRASEPATMAEEERP